MRPSGNCSTPHSISRPTTAASMSTFGSLRRAKATASGTSSQAVTRRMPTDEPAREGLTNTGRPRRSRSAAVRSAAVRSRATASPTPSPASRSSAFVTTLSIDAALAPTPAPT